MNTYHFEDLKKQLNEWIALDYINPEDVPAIELYMDQITTFMDKQLAGNKRNAEDKILTKTMINNYSKNDLLPPSDKKKYSRDHIILLIYIYYMKNFLSIGDIQKLLHPITDAYFQAEEGLNMSDLYHTMFALEKEYGVRIRKSIEDVYTIADGYFQDDQDDLKTFAMILMLSYDIYAKKQLIERMIDNLYPAAPTKAERKEAREAAKKQEKADKKADANKPA